MNHLVLQSDFGLNEGAVAQMYGVSLQLAPQLQIYNLTHEIPSFDTWGASYSLYQVVLAWAVGTVFVSVVDPGVGSKRTSVVAHTASDHYVVTPNNGSLTHLADRIGVVEVREIDETRHRRPGSEHIHVFHGRDVYAYTGAKLAAGMISFADVGEVMDLQRIEMHPLRAPCIDGRGCLEGMVEIDDRGFGMVWSNIPLSLMDEFGMRYGGVYAVEIKHRDRVMYSATIPYARSFSAVKAGEDLLYLNATGNLAVASNLGSFLERSGISYGYEWTIHIAPAADSA